MADMKTQNQRRKHKRFEVQDGAFVLLGPDSNKLGSIKNVSLGGLSFSHKARKSASSELYELDIFFIGQDFYLEQVPFRAVWDLATKENPFSSITMRRAGVKFGDLTHSQLSRLEYFIENHSIAKTLDTYSMTRDGTESQERLFA
jgi:hypothetical protein